MPEAFVPFWEAIRFQARLDPHSVAVSANTGQIGYGAFWNDIQLATRHLDQARLPQGTRVAVQVQHMYLRWLATIALARLGLVSAAASDSPQELDLIDPQVVISDRPDTGGGRPLIEAGEHWLAGGADANLALPDADPAAPCRLVLSSGTTGTPRKALLSLANVQARTRANARSYGLYPGVRLATTMSPQAVGGFTMPLSCWIAGGTVVMATVPAAAALPQLLQLRPQVLFLSPMQLAELMETLPADYLAAEQPRIYVAGSPLPGPLSEAVRLRLTQALFISYGSTETGTVSIGHAARADRQPGFTGHVVPSACIEIVDQLRRPVPAGTPGEVRMRTESMIAGYGDGDGGGADADADADCFRDGWFHPGDTGVLDPDGGLTIVGRTREVMNFGGVKLAPEAVERALRPCPGVADLAAFSLREGSIERPWVAVVPADGFASEPLQRRFAAAFPRLPALSVAQLGSLPRNQMGKVLRDQLAALVRAAVADGAALPQSATPPSPA